jgi:hypothetical protein
VSHVVDVVITQNWELVEAIAQKLMERRTLDADDIKAIYRELAIEGIGDRKRQSPRMSATAIGIDLSFGD